MIIYLFTKTTNCYTICAVATIDSATIYLASARGTNISAEATKYKTWLYYASSPTWSRIVPAASCYNCVN
ncbi:MAG: hypothetical protein HC939_23500 [Pleurocapsa sp. SU_5_0]|nr:hypothetical protein [Pleurocapsa sp. SU_5_0]